MHNQEGALEQNRSKAQPNIRTGLEYQHGSHPGLARNPPEQGGGDWAGPGCDRTHGADALPPAPPGPTFLWQCIQCTGRRLHAVFPKIPEQTNHPQDIKGGPLFTF